jgi:hypothetical protein
MESKNDTQIEVKKSDKTGGGSSMGTTLAKRGSRVMAAVAAFNGKAKEVGKEKEQPTPLSPKEVEAAFEALLVSHHPLTLDTTGLICASGFEKHSPQHAR